MLLLKVDEKGIALRVVIDPAIPRRLTGDPTRINQVLINLAGNAVKFTDKGFVEVKATLMKQDGDKYVIRFDVTDTGIGIAAEHVDTIFDSFTQAGADVTRKFGGTGLGLTISKQLVGLMGGDIFVQSELGKGTTFTAVITLEEASVQEDVKAACVLDTESMARLNKLKVLLVEDNEFNRMVAEDTLRELIPGINLQVAVHGQDAINKLQREYYDILLMDIQMPVMDGLTATKLIRNTMPEPSRSVKIIAMTANVMQEDVQEYFNIGMNAYVSKPFNADELLLKMDAVMANTDPVGDKRPAPTVQATPPPPPPAPAPPPPPPPPPANKFADLPERVTDMTFLKGFTGGNMEKQQKYMGMFLENAPKLLESIERGLANKDYQTVKIAAHSLKPQLGYMGVKEDVSNIFLIEQSSGETAHHESLPDLVENLKRLCNKAFEELRNIK
jgi:hypothetical protein